MFHKIALVSFFSTMLFVGLLGLSESAQAASTCTPIMNVQETKETSVKLKVTCSSLKNTKVKIKILVSNDDTDSDSYKSATATLGKNGSVNFKISGLDSATSWSTKTFSLTLDDDGEGSLTMDDLKSDTLYSFKIRIRKNGSSSYSIYSPIKTVTTDED